METNF